MEHIGGYERGDIAKFQADTSGGARARRAGGEQVPDGRRIWHAMHRMYQDGLVAPSPVRTFSSGFQVAFSRELLLALRPTAPGGGGGGWAEVRILDLLKRHMLNAATSAIFGPRILEMCPGLAGAFWEYERHAETLLFGLPSWANSEATRARDTFNAICHEWFELADLKFDWEAEGASPGQDEVEPVFGARISRSLAEWGKAFHFSPKTMGGTYGLFFFG